MTTFQDLPPQSRRSARQSERGERPDTPAGFTDFTPQIEPAEPEPTESTHNEAGPDAGVTSEPAFETPSASVPNPTDPLRTGEVPPLSGRRARANAQQGLFEVSPGEQAVPPASGTAVPGASILGAEPLEYMTQGRDLPDTYRAPEPQQPPQPQFRVRDYSPEGRASGRRAAVPPLIEPEPLPQSLQLPTDLDYRTHAGPAAVTFPAPVAEPEDYPEPVRYIPPVDGEDEDVDLDEHSDAVDSDAVRADDVGVDVDSVLGDSALGDSVLGDSADVDSAPVDETDSEPVDFSAGQIPAFESAAFPVDEPVAAAAVDADPSRPITAEVVFETPAVVDETPIPPVASPPDPPLTRRELRARLAQEEAAQAALLTGPQEPALVTGPQENSFPPPPQASALLTGQVPPPAASALLTGQVPPPPAASALLTGQVPPPPAASALLTGQVPPPPAASALLTGQVPPPPAASALLTGQVPPPPASYAQIMDAAAPPIIVPTPEPVVESPAPTIFDGPPASSVPSPASVTPTFIEPELEHTGGWEAPVGHWSRQADLDDENQPWENTVTREVGGGNVATTTSALVLPEMPLANPFPSALTGTGEILLTGSIDLPRSLSSGSGDSRHFDDTNVDLMYDTPDSEIASTDSAPVSAIRAVSTHTSARGVISSKKPQGNRMLTVLLVTASVMAVGVVILLVAGLMGNVF